jgi:hypothetical protein
LTTNIGLRGYRDLFAKQSLGFASAGHQPHIVRDERVNASHPFIRIVAMEPDKTMDLLSINLQLQWQNDH